MFFVLVFKVMIDLFVGLFIFIRVYFGIIEFGFYAYNFVKGKKECIGCFFEMYVNECEDVKVVCIGDIVVIVGFKDIIIGDMLCD